MSIDLLNIKPHEVSRDLCGYTVLMYGQPKTGKTTTAAHFPDALLLAFETGYLAIPGIKAVPMNSWGEFKKVLKQLKDDEVKKMYKNIIVDTADLSYSLCEKYICTREGVESISDIPFGGGYKMAENEFDEALRLIPQLGYGLVLISHAQDKTFTDENGVEFNQIVPTLANKPRLVVDRMSDIILYAHPVQDEDGMTRTIGYMRGTPRFVAGSRFKYTPDYIEFSYDNLVKALNEAIDKQAEEIGNKFVTDEKTKAHETIKYDFDALMIQFKDIIKIIQDNTGDDFGKVWAPKITKITEEYLGKGRKVNDMTPDQAEQLDLIVADLLEEVGNGL